MYKRSERVGEVLREEISRIVQREIMNSECGLITITEVKLTSDLRHARAYFSVYGSEKNKKKARELLKRFTPLVRRQIGAKIKLRSTPHIEFVFDTIPEKADQINELLEKIKKEQEK